MSTTVLSKECRVDCLTKYQAEKQLNRSINKVLNDDIPIKDLFEYESRFSTSDEFDELW